MQIENYDNLLMQAVIDGRTSDIEPLIQKGANVYKIDENANTLIHLALIKKHKDTAAFLINKLPAILSHTIKMVILFSS